MKLSYLFVFVDLSLQVAPLAPAVNSNFLSSDSEPKFELKGTIFSSVSPLGSDSTHIDVYNSDKLNFL